MQLLAGSIVAAIVGGLILTALLWGPEKGMTLNDWLTIVAIIVAPVAAVQIQRWLDVVREGRGRKLWVFKTLMATRAAVVAPEHVQALNMIDRGAAIFCRRGC